MKKRMIGTLLAMALLLSACSGQPATSTTTATAPTTEATTAATTTATTTTPTTAATTTAVPTTIATTVAPTTASAKLSFITIESDAARVRLTMPKAIFDLIGIDPKDLMLEAYAQGVSSAQVNPDGSLTYNMTKAEYQGILGEIKTMVDENIKALTTDKNTAFRSIKYNAKMTEFQVRVDRKKFSSADAMAAMGLQMPGVIYQIYLGIDLKDIVVVINFIDKDTGKVFETSGSVKLMP